MLVQVGDAVKITEGPLSGFGGRLKALGQRVLIVVAIHGRELQVEIDLDWVAAAAPERRTASSTEKHKIQRRTSA